MNGNFLTFFHSFFDTVFLTWFFSPKIIKFGFSLVFVWGQSQTGYSTLNDVKEVLRIDTTDTTNDTELTNCIASADALIDNLAKYDGFTVPFSPVPAAIANASKHFASWFFRMRGSPPAEAKTLWDLGMKFYETYRDAEKNIQFLGRV